MAKELQFGLLLPHFGEHASVVECLDGARRAEAYGFDSVWVRDHLIFTPHQIEGANNTHIEGMLLLAAISSVTTKIKLGTAMTICHRHPIHLAQLGASLSVLSGGRLILGIGLGGFAHEFAAAGWPTDVSDRAALVKANVEILRRLWSGESVSYSDRWLNFENVEQKPRPLTDIPIWIGGGTLAACRRAVALGEGWLPARVTLATFASRVAHLRDLCRAAARPMIKTAVMPLTTIGKDRQSSLRGVDVKTIIDESQRFTTWVNTAETTVSEAERSRGLLLAGTTADIVRETRAFAEAGADHVVYDLRLRFAEWHEQLDLLGKEVLPALRS